MNISATTTTPSNRLSLSNILSPTEQNNLYSMTQPFSKANLIYRATTYGFQASAFHSKCDNITNTVTVIGNNFNYVFGGFTAAKWSSGTVLMSNPTAFIFSLRRNGGLTNYKLAIRSTEVNDAIFSDSLRGPTFGRGYDIVIRDQSNTKNGSFSFLYTYTEPTYPSGSDRYTFLTGGYQNWLTTEIEVYQLF